MLAAFAAIAAAVVLLINPAHAESLTSTRSHAASAGSRLDLDLRASGSAGAGMGAGASSHPGSGTHDPRAFAAPDTWPSTGEYAILGGLTAGLVLSMTALPGPGAPRFSGGLLFDDAARGMIRLDSAAGRETAGHVSDTLQYGLLLYPVLDGVLGNVFGDGGSDELLHTLVDDAQAFMVTGVALGLLKSGMGRARPGGMEGDPSGAQSFPSRHTAMAFTGAGLVCSHHLSGDDEISAAGVALCATGLGVATTTGLLRIAADRHYTTDVLAGAAIGLASGLLVPRLIHGLLSLGDESPEIPHEGAPRFSLAPDIREDYRGVTLRFE